jgi:hypothetical protein
MGVLASHGSVEDAPIALEVAGRQGSLGELRGTRGEREQLGDRSASQVLGLVGPAAALCVRACVWWWDLVGGVQPED